MANNFLYRANLRFMIVMSSLRIMIQLFCITIFFFYGLCFSKTVPNYSFVHQATSASAISYYDYIIIGGGTAGCPLAATLSQNANVLLLERGDSPYGNPNITNLSAFGRPLFDLSQSSPSQRFISEDGVVNARARVLGGGTCINAGFYSRAATDYIRDAGWDGALVNKSYEWVEKILVFQPRLTQWQSAVRDGLLKVGVKPYNGFKYDNLIGTKIGGSIFDHRGQRHTAANFLKYANPKGLNVLLHASVQKILFITKGKNRPFAHGVEFIDASGNKHKAYINPGRGNEIIISAGAIGSPQLLMLSGIGPSDHLKAHNIPLVLDLPLVGQGMSDNPMNVILVPSPRPIEVSSVQVVGITKFGNYIEAVSGINVLDASAINTVFQGGIILEKILGPISEGHLELRNKNLSENPLVTFNYFKEPIDLKRCVAGLKVVEGVIKSKSFSSFKYANHTIPILLNMTASIPANLRSRHANTSTSLEQFCKDTVMTIWHYHGGCQVGRVVDSDYKVLGVDALRVIDSSTFDYSPGTNPQATVMMLGRYMGVKILKERLDHI